MLRALISRFTKEDRAAIGPLYAIGISTFVVISAIGFDYGRLMSLDTELQNAADQAALAAATQLDGGDDAMTRARDAATNAFASASSSFTNETRFANDRLGRPITDLEFEFFDDYFNDRPGNLLTNDTDGAQAKVVQVTVNARKVFYALTPLVGVLNSGDVIGKAMAGLQSATCNVPPMMFCVPNDGTGNAQTDFPTSADIGRGLKLHFKTNGNSNCTGNGCGQNTTDTSVWAPGNFGFLDIDYDGIANSDKVRTLGLNEGFLGCAGEVIESDPGYRDPQGDALNSRFDIYSGSVNKNTCNAGGDFCPAENTTKNWVNVQTKNGGQPKTCASSPPNGSTWVRAETVSGVTNPGYPADTAFNGIVGSGDWTGSTWIPSAHPGWTVGDVPDFDGNGAISRYETYIWELSNPGSLLQPRKVGEVALSGNRTDVYCAYPQPVQAAALPSSSTQKDRRLLTVAAVDCTGLNGSAPVKILRWVDLFLVQPSNTSSSDKNFLTEIVGPATRAGGESGFQYYGRKKAVLIR